MDERYIALGALTALAKDGELDRDVVAQAMEDLDIDPEKADPVVS